MNIDTKLPSSLWLWHLIARLVYRVSNSLTVGQKVMTVIAVEILSYSVITTIALYQIHIMGNEIRQMANLSMPLLTANASIQQLVQDERLHIKDVVFYGDRVVYDKDAEDTYIQARINYQTANAKINELLNESETMIEEALVSAGTEDVSTLKTFAPSLLDNLTRIRDAQIDTAERVGRIFLHVEDGSFLMGMEQVNGVYESEQVLLGELKNLESLLQEMKAGSLTYAANSEITSSRMMILASIATFCVVMTIFFFVIKRHISRPLHTLTDAIKTFDPLEPVRSGEEEARLLSRGDELGMVARSLIELKQTLRNQGQALQAAKEEAERADRAKTRFLAAASHDLRQPLHAMQMYIAALRQRVKDKQGIAIIDDIHAVAHAAARLLNSLLDVSQLEAGAIKPQLEVFAVQDLLKKVSISFMPLAEKRGLELRVVQTSSHVYSDPALMERIIGNFLSNAIRYTESGRILLGCRNRGRDVLIQVCDTGVGVPENQLHAIFEDFHQLQNDERDRSKGLGLGLAIVRRLADCLDHQVEVKSKVGRGSCFGVLAERASSARSRALRDESNESLDSIHDLAGLNILLIEDDNVVADATMLLLKSWKCQVWAARTTEDAVDLVETGNCVPELVLADYRLPGGSDGVDAIQRIQVSLQIAVPGIIVTGESDITAIREIEQMGYMILRKPLRPAKLRRVIAHYAGRLNDLSSAVA